MTAARLFIIETAAQATRLPSLHDNDRVLATTFPAIEALRQAGCGYCTPRAFTPHTWLRAEIEAGRRRVALALAAIDAELAVGGLPHPLFASFAYMLMLQWESCQAPLLLLERALTELRPSEVCYFADPDPAFRCDALLFYAERNLLFGRAAQLLAAAGRQKRRFTMTEELLPQPVMALPAGLPSRAAWRGGLWSVLQAVRYCLPGGSPLLSSGDVSWRAARRPLLFANYRILELTTLTMDYARRFVAKAEIQPGNTPALLEMAKRIISGIDDNALWPALQPSWLHLLTRTSVWRELGEDAERQLSMCNMKGVAVSYFQTPPHGPFFSLIAGVARKRKVPVFCWQHGGGLGMLSHQPYAEWYESGQASILLVWGEGIREHIADRIPLARTAAVGCPAWRPYRYRRQRQAPVIPRVLWLPRNYYLDSHCKIWNDDTFYDDMQRDWHWQTLNSLREIADDMELTIKLQDQPAVRTCFENWCEQLAFPSARVLTHETTARVLLSSTDLAVVDWCSTTFAEASRAGVAVIVVSGNGLIPEFAAFARQRAHLCDSPHEVAAAVRRWRNGEGQPTPAAIRKFNERYFGDDGAKWNPGPLLAALAGVNQ